ncbi:MAG: response regulator transcription factor [Elusimicrobiota bacterium]
MTEEKPEGFNIEKGARVGVSGGASVIRPTLTIADPLTPGEIATFEKLLGKPGAHGAPAPVEGLSALVAEDDPQFRRLLAMILDRLHCRPLEVADGANALKALVKYKVDMVVLDLRMPLIDGYSVIRGVRGYLKLTQLPIVVISGLSDVKDEAAALNIGADGYLRKPFNLEQMEAHLRAVLRKAQDAKVSG